MWKGEGGKKEREAMREGWSKRGWRTERGNWVECFALCLLTSLTVFSLNLAKNSTYKTDNKGATC